MTMSDPEGGLPPEFSIGGEGVSAERPRDDIPNPLAADESESFDFGEVNQPRSDSEPRTFRSRVIRAGAFTLAIGAAIVPATNHLTNTFPYGQRSSPKLVGTSNDDTGTDILKIADSSDIADSLKISPDPDLLTQRNTTPRLLARRQKTRQLLGFATRPYGCTDTNVRPTITLIDTANTSQPLRIVQSDGRRSALLNKVSSTISTESGIAPSEETETGANSISVFVSPKNVEIDNIEDQINSYFVEEKGCQRAETELFLAPVSPAVQSIDKETIHGIALEGIYQAEKFTLGKLKDFTFEHFLMASSIYVAAYLGIVLSLSKLNFRKAASRINVHRKKTVRGVKKVARLAGSGFAILSNINNSKYKTKKKEKGIFDDIKDGHFSSEESQKASAENNQQVRNAHNDAANSAETSQEEPPHRRATFREIREGIKESRRRKRS